MKTLLLIVVALALAVPALAYTVVGEYPICKAAMDVDRFSQARLFNDLATLDAMVADGSCTFVEPDVKAKIVESTTTPKVIVFLPYKQPLVGYTHRDNLR